MRDHPAYSGVRTGQVTAETWTVDQVANYLGIRPKSADTELRRQSIEPVARQPGRGGKNLYDSGAIRARWPNRGHPAN